MYNTVCYCMIMYSRTHGTLLDFMATVQRVEPRHLGVPRGQVWVLLLLLAQLSRKGLAYNCEIGEPLCRYYCLSGLVCLQDLDSLGLAAVMVEDRGGEGEVGSVPGSSLVTVRVGAVGPGSSLGTVRVGAVA